MGRWQRIGPIRRGAIIANPRAACCRGMQQSEVGDGDGDTPDEAAKSRIRARRGPAPASRRRRPGDSPTSAVPFTRTVARPAPHRRRLARRARPSALIPTMGALHDGHLQLVRVAKRRCDRAVVSIFVNPAQFAPNEDFDKYPRTWESDLAQLATVDCDLVWSPERLECTRRASTRASSRRAPPLASRPISARTSSAAWRPCVQAVHAGLPDIAVFGEKDYQQLCVIRQMVRDLNLPLEIVGADGARSGRPGDVVAQPLPVARRAGRAVTIHHVIKDWRGSRPAGTERRDRRWTAAADGRPASRSTMSTFAMPRHLRDCAGLDREEARAGRRMARPDAPDRQRRGV